ncbi:InlB B-repeat-containing protein, partial [Salmonella sp. SAL4357]|uniref:InlB B-repeat-containing protein n=1 Tax=Salmonella sp. SAL4357 TaxID=3159878 RepID=UPI00397E6432
PGSGSRFSGWTGACTGAAATCTVTMDAAKSVQAVFTQSTFLLALAVSGKGAVGAPALRLACTRWCSAAVEADSVVRIRATP